ncbi:MAG TPA: type II secretion system protein GspM [Candidatus Binataceae bacterium]|nr:type II secretion system protein GspM [Candidatus Binataceae bacterium]
MFDRIRNLGTQSITLPPSVRRLGARAAAPLRPLFDRLKVLTRPAWESWRSFYEKREPREKRLLRFAGALLAVLFAYDLFYLPIAGWRQDLADRVATRRRDLIEVRSLMRTYDRLQHSLEVAQRRTLPGGPNFSLFSVLEQTLTTTAGRDRIGSITPSDHPVPGGFRQYTVDIKLNGITLPQIVDTLYGVQSLSMPVTVSTLEIHQQARDPHAFDVDMTCMALGKDG